MQKKKTVFVLAPDGEPLDPCTPKVARLLLRDGNAKVKRREPFTIKLTREPQSRHTHPCTIGVDTGSSTAGFAAVTDAGEVRYASEVTLRNDIKKKMDRRREYRKTRRARKTRHRKPRFNNRKNSKKEGRLSPTLKEKIHAHEREISFIRSILPCRQEVIVETGHFDPYLLKNPALADPKIKPWGYQRGPTYGFSNAKEAARHRDGYRCRLCGKKGGRLEEHHYIWRNKGGPDTVDNLVTLCPGCHHKVHIGKARSPKPLKNIERLSAPTHMNIIASQLRKSHPEIIETHGYITKANRENLGLAKSHYVDAAVIASGGRPVAIDEETVFIKRCVPEGDYQRTKGMRSEKKISQGKICGFKKFDKVRYRGREWFVKGRRLRGTAELMDITGKKADFSFLPRGLKTPKLSAMSRILARKTVLTVPLSVAA